MSPGAGGPVAAIEPMIALLRWWDIEEVVAVERQLFGDDPWSPAQFWSELARVGQSRHYIIARDAGAVVGYAGLFLVGSQADVQTIAVAPRAQHRGIGRLLLGNLLAVARSRAVDRVHLEVRADNEAALRLYRRSGFREVGLRRDYYGRGMAAILMSIELSTQRPRGSDPLAPGAAEQPPVAAGSRPGPDRTSSEPGGSGG